MDTVVLQMLLEKIHGVTFATIDTETKTKNLLKVTKGERILLFRTKGGSGYEAMVNRRLAEAGLPANFKVGPLPWGERVNDLPLITHNGKHYLQCISLTKPEAEYFLPGNVPVPDPSIFGVRPRKRFPDLPEDKQVFVSCYDIEHITRLALMGEELEDSAISDKPKRAILKLNFERK